MRHLALLLLCVLSVIAVAGEVSTQVVEYRHGELTLRGYQATPTGAVGVPGVLVVHEWWGANDYAQRRARELAERGYAAFACDMYGAGATTEDPKQAGALAGPFYQDRGLMVARARAGLEQLAKAPGVDPKRLSAIGFCFGGTVVLELARAGEPLRLAASFHGGLKTTTAVQPGAILAQILVLHGGSDPMVPPAEVAGFISEMVAAKADWRMEVYGTALHAFTNPKARDLHAVIPAVDYDAAAEAASLAALRDALALRNR
jgi:dienelactone hydrolase